MEGLAGDRRLRPWWIGLATIAVTDALTAYLFITRACPAGAGADIVTLVFVMIFLVLPVIYLALMFVTLKSQP